MNKKIEAIAALRPGSEFVLYDNKDILWITQGVESPTETEIQAEIKRLESEATAQAAAAQAATSAAIAHAKSLGFTDDMIAVMYPNLRSESPIVP